MPRLSTTIIRRARALHPLLPPLLRPCRDLRSAQNELRWLREHAIANHQATPTSSGRTKKTSWQQHLHRMCHERARGKPLQYILGTQPFGPLEILCKKGVLIPRPETENITTHLAALLLTPSPPPSALRILDLCTGTGCIPLLLHSHLGPHIRTLHLHGIDISRAATTLAAQNLTHNAPITFSRGDIFAATPPLSDFDVLLANPPYISPSAYDSSTSRSVRNHEPKDALVPSATVNCKPGSHTDPGDVFYPRILEIAEEVCARVVLVEVADMAQAVRVARMVVERERGWGGCEIWRDWPAGSGGVVEVEGGGEVVEVQGVSVRVKGEGNGRAVLAWRGEEGGRMIGKC